MRRTRLAASWAALATLAAGCSLSDPAPAVPSSDTLSEAAMDVSTDTLDALSVAQPPPMFLGEGVTPPTNRWYSSLAFGSDLGPVFASPLSFQAADASFSFGLPAVSAGPDAVAAPAVPAVTVGVAGASGRPLVTHADPVAVGLTYSGIGPGPVADVSLAAGWPVVAVTAVADVALNVTPGFDSADAGLGTVEVDGVTYGVKVNGGSVAGGQIELTEGGTAQFFAVPSGGSAESFASALGDPVRDVDIAVSAGEDTATTQLTYVAEGDQTVLTLPADRDTDAACELGTYDTLNGTLHVCAGRELSWNVPAREPTTTYDLGAIDEDERDAIVAALADDIARLDTYPADTYFGGKALHRTAMLVELADALGQDQLTATALASLTEELAAWTNAEDCAQRQSRCFVYDPAVRGVVGLEATFGADEFNDHHFHYGYFLTAAAVAARHDPELVERVAPVIDLLAADIASPGDTGAFPALRPFDPYRGHSWASGYQPFVDGNNQESSSEAVMAWNGLALWAQVREDSGLEETARWMLAAETDAALRTWVYPDMSAFPEYAHDIVSLQWGAKREYATWFSTDPSAILGIQLIPMAPAQAYLVPDSPERTARAQSAVAAGTVAGYESPLGDYVLMFHAMLGDDARAAAWEAAVALPDSAIDDGNARSLLLATIAAAGTNS